MALTEDELPVLNDVVRSGNETIIRTSRLQRFDIDELDSSSTGPLHFELPPHLQFDNAGYETDRDPYVALLFDETMQLDASASTSTWAPQPEPALETLIDEIVDNHITSLRKELRSLLERARDLP